MSDTDTSTHPILATYTAMDIPCYEVGFDGFGKISGMLEFNGEVYRFTAKRLRRFRVLKVWSDGTVRECASGVTDERHTENWIPDHFYHGDYGFGTGFKLVLEIETEPDKWERMQYMY